MEKIKLNNFMNKSFYKEGGYTISFFYPTSKEWNNRDEADKVIKKCLDELKKCLKEDTEEIPMFKGTMEKLNNL